MKTKKLLYLLCTLLFSLFVFNANVKAEVPACISAGGKCLTLAGVTCETLNELDTWDSSTNSWVPQESMVSSSLSCIGGGGSICCLPKIAVTPMASAQTSCPTGQYLGRDKQCYPNSNLSNGGCPTGEYRGKDGQCYPDENLDITATGDSDPTCDPSPSCLFWNCCSSSSNDNGGGSTNSGAATSSGGIMCDTYNGICRDLNGNEVPNPGGSVGAGGGVTPGANQGSSPKCGRDGKFTEIGGVCFPNNTGLSNAPVYVILSNIFSWLMGLFTTLAILAFVVSGVQYFMSSADEDMAKSAKKNATNAVIGIIVGLSGFVIIRAIAAALEGGSYFF
ncbi:MAG: hypothetical protein ACD_5C00228G0008 [uncultured bacterium]|nr:MAG: hypothetical protein ACD_5C00228G0008 [uncultured bacterium]